MLGKDTSANHNDKAEWESIQTYEGKKEWNRGKEDHGGKEEWNGVKKEHGGKEEWNGGTEELDDK
jgi:hypothetical protein